MIIRKTTESRLAYLLRVAIQYCKDNGENTIEYDGTDCDGYCLADDLQTELDGLPDVQEPCTPETHAKPLPAATTCRECGTVTQPGFAIPTTPDAGAAWHKCAPLVPVDKCPTCGHSFTRAYPQTAEEWLTTARRETQQRAHEHRRPLICTCETTGTPDHQAMSRQTCPRHSY